MKAKQESPSRMKPLPWTPREPTVETAHDVRRLAICLYCEKLGGDLLRIPGGTLFPGIGRNRAPVHAHGYCLITRGGLALFAALSAEEIGKITVDEMLALRMTLKQVSDLMMNAKRRQRRQKAKP